MSPRQCSTGSRRALGDNKVIQCQYDDIVVLDDIVMDHWTTYGVGEEVMESGSIIGDWDQMSAPPFTNRPVVCIAMFTGSETSGISLMQLCGCLTLRKVHCRDTGGKNFKESRPLSTVLLLARLFVISLKQVVICYQVKFCTDISILCMRWCYGRFSLGNHLFAAVQITTSTNYAFRFVHHCTKTLLFVLHVACDDFLAFSPTSV